MILTHNIIFIAISRFQLNSSINFARLDITGVWPQPLPHSTSKSMGKTAVLPVLSLVAAQNSEEKKEFKEEMKEAVVKKVHVKKFVTEEWLAVSSS